MTFRRAATLGWVLLGTCLLPWSVEGENKCVVNCNRQYEATVRYCAEGIAKNPDRKAWYNDCIKNARKFRKECLRKCKM